MFVQRVLLTALCCVLVQAADVHAQSATADLRYVAPLPDRVVFTTIDSLTSTISGLPTGDMTTTGVMRSVNELRFMSDTAGMRVAAKLVELTAQMNTPLGAMPMNAGESEPIELAMRETGPDAEELFARQATPAFGSPEGPLSSGRALVGLMTLPGRTLRRGETWTDTTAMSPAIQGLETTMTMVVRLTYVGDTAVAGRTLNVLQLTSEITARTSGVVQGMPLNQNVTINGNDDLLWDSTRHTLVQRRGSMRMRSEAKLPNGVTVTSTANARSVTTSSRQL